MLHLSSSNNYQTGSTLLLHLLGTLLATALALPLAFTSIQAVGVRTSISAKTRGDYHPLSPGNLPSNCCKKKNDVAKMRQAGTAPATGTTIYCLTSLWCNCDI